jgi:transcriptional regulator
MPRSLEDAFQVNIDRIKHRKDAKAHQGMEILKRTYLAERQLTVVELRHALAATDSISDSLNLNDLPFENTLLNCCHGLVVLNEETSSIRLVHKSLQEFLKKKHENKELFKTGHRDIYLTCLKYMRFKDTTSITQPTDESDYYYNLSLFDRSPFLRYSSSFWGEHAREQIDQEVTDRTLEFLSNEYRHALSHRRLYIAVTSEALYENQGFCGLHLAAYFGLVGVTNAIIDRFGDNTITLSVCDNTPMMLATRRGLEAIVRLLLEKRNVVHNLAKPLEIAIENGFENIVDLLLDNGDESTINLKVTHRSESLLSCAASNGHLPICLLLLQKGADIESRDNYGCTPLSLASYNGHTDVVNLLLERGADMESRDNYGHTPLSGASFEGHTETVRLLLDKGANIQS